MKLSVMRVLLFWIIISAFLISSNSCNIPFWSGETKFSDIKVGKIFEGSRDGYFEKLPHNYCLLVEYRYDTTLCKVADEFLDLPWDDTPYPYYNDYIIRGHYIKGYYNDNYLILCEEKTDNSYIYHSFNFSTQHMESYTSEQDVYQIYGFTAKQWSTLCNTNAQISR